MPDSLSRHEVFITGGSGFMGRQLISLLLGRGHRVRALVRPGSEKKLPAGCAAIIGNALDKNSYSAAIAPADTFVQLVGVTHPNPSKGQEFLAVDKTSALGAIAAAAEAGVKHFVYVSVAQPAPVMKNYIAARAECEAALRASGLNATIIRPWYVLGPGRRWPYLIAPMYWIMERIPATREGARRLGLVTLPQMITALASAVEHPAQGIRIVTVPEIRSSRLAS